MIVGPSLIVDHLFSQLLSLLHINSKESSSGSSIKMITGLNKESMVEALD